MLDKKNWFNTPYTAVLVNLILLMVLVISVAGGILIIQGVRGEIRPYERDSVTITGEGKVKAISDIGYLEVTIVTKNVDTNVAQDENIQQFNKLVAALKKSGIEDKDLRTQSYNVYPNYEWENGKRIDLGFEVRQTLNVTIRNLENAGDVVKIAGQSGVNEVGGLSFSVEEPEQYKEEARKKALKNAKQKAEELANIMGVKLGKVISFSESDGGYYPGPVFARGLALDEGIGGASEALSVPSFEQGEEEIIIRSTIIYEVK